MLKFRIFHIGLRENPNLTSDDMDDLRCQVIAVDGENATYPQNIPAPQNIPDDMLQLGEGYSWILEGLIYLRKSSNIHNNYADFKNYYREEVTKMKTLELF